MSNQSETMAAVRRAAVRAAFHLLKAGVESLKALEAVIDELGSVGEGGRTDEDGDDDRPVRIEIE